ncbi:Os02g0462100 [Oryza sativa Japonica Group]|uniref:Os02g0462100 protein n=1 Tax=Oryza sativa subsp. japonica TaxID=39947 RepID=A0A0P0VIS8_ORYSJ|nr:Os02g0462100 [Oryza sativa Japonica Group]
MAGMLADHPLDTLRIRQQQPSSPAIRHQSSCPDRKRACAEPEEERKEWEEEAAAGVRAASESGGSNDTRSEGRRRAQDEMSAPVGRRRRME